MRKKYFTLIAVAVAVLLVVTATSLAVDRDQDAVKTARADVAMIAPVGVPGRAEATRTARNTYDFRNSAALVLVGSMLLGLAAAVRRTA